MLLIEVQDRYDREDLRQKWVTLERQCRPSFFLSWRWIGAWIAVAATAPLLVKCYRHGEIVALGLLQRHTRRRGLIAARQLCLHETGDAVLDAPMIEHNGFLIAQEDEGLVATILQYLQSDAGAWDEILLSGISTNTAREAQTAGLILNIDREYPIFVARLSKDRPWLEGRSKGLRAQLRQSRSFAEQMGPVELVAASGVLESVAFFEQMVVLHSKYWRSRKKAGAFATDYSRAFHRHLIATPEAGGEVFLLRLQAGSEVLGYLYNFRAGDRMYAYQSGFAYRCDNRHRPGLLAHALALEHAASQGVESYDFLAGESSYKARLGERHGSLLWARAQRRHRPLLTVERAALAFKRWLA
jgi:CelD/BcsL family acetyltransferase involved in cellulose biosynthesis